MSDPRLDSILAWNYRVLAEEAQTFAHAINDPQKRRILEDLAHRYLALAEDASPQEASD